LVAAPVTRTASSRRSRSISSVVLMHRASHESYAGSTAMESPGARRPGRWGGRSGRSRQAGERTKYALDIRRGLGAPESG
jgi:hypothetical protein